VSARSRLRDLLEVAVLGCIGIVVVAGYASYRIWSQGQRDDQRRADAIVVMGAAQYNGRPSPVFAARLDHAIALYHEGLAPYLVTTGGRAPGDVLSEAEAARTYALRQGVPPDAILSEDQGRDTVASIEGVTALMRERGLRSAVFVSDRLHMLRVLRIALDEGIEAYGSPTTTSPADTTPERWLRSLGHELGGLADYLLLGR
jgi:uncharacterized SAM-binding protein YcdF (DUF218 family)